MGSIKTIFDNATKKEQRDKMKNSFIIICILVKGILGIPLTLEDIVGPGDIDSKAASTYQNCNCQCDSYTWTDGAIIRGNCESQDKPGGALFCYVTGSALCSCRDIQVSTAKTNSDGTSKLYSYEACTTPPKNSCNNIGLQNYGSGDFQHCQTGQNVGPLAPPSGSGTNCRTEYKTINVIVETEKFERKCVQKYRNECVQKSKRVCTPYQEKVCQTVNNQQCYTKYRDYCYEAYRDVMEPYTENICVDKGQRRCDKHWQCANPSQSLANCNDKIWVEDQTSCKTLLATECTDVTNYRTVKQPYQKCEQESYDDCKNVPSQVCETVTRERCDNVPWNDCQDVPYQHCEDVHKTVPEQVQQQKLVTICDNNDYGNDYGNGNVNARVAEASVINPRESEAITFEA